mgnify:CR=1 FL=1
MTIEIALLISVLSVAFSIYFGLRNSKRNESKDIEERVADSTRINVKLDNISVTTTDVKNEISSMRDEMKTYNERLIKVEESTKQAHHRLDGIEDRMNGGR